MAHKIRIIYAAEKKKKIMKNFIRSDAIIIIRRANVPIFIVVFFLAFHTLGGSSIKFVMDQLCHEMCIAAA